MTLDAHVSCNCFERGCLRELPRPEWEVYIAKDGSPDAKTKDTKLQVEFAEWAWHRACDHEFFDLLSHHIGHVALVRFYRNTLSNRASDFPLLLEKVLYNGIHAGDFLSVEQVRELKNEVDNLKEVHCDNKEDEELLRRFEQQMRELTECSLSVGKPIVF